MHKFVGDDTLAHAQLTNSQARSLRRLLNKPATKEMLGIPQLKPEHIVTEHEVQLGEHYVEVHEDGSVAICNARAVAELGAGEAYHLYTVLHELFAHGRGA